MSLVQERESVNTPRQRISIIEHAIAEGTTIHERPHSTAVFSDAAVVQAPVPAQAQALTPTSESAPANLDVVTPLDDISSAFLAFDIEAPELPTAVRPKRLAKKFSLIDPNQAWVMWVAVILLGGILASNLASSFTSVYAMAAWVGAPPAVQWLPVVILDVAIVGFSWALMVFASRLADPDENAEDKTIVREKTGRTRFYLAFVTCFSVVANFMHTFTFWHENLTTAQAITGVVFSACIPLMALVATEELIRLVFIRRRKIQADSE